MHSTNSSAARLPRQVPGTGLGPTATTTPASAQPPKPGALTPLETPHLIAKPSGSSPLAHSTAAAAVLIGILAAYAATPSNAGTGVERLRELLDEVVAVCGKLGRHAPICATAKEHHRLTRDFRDPVMSTPTFMESNGPLLLLGATVLVLYLHLKRMRAI